MSTPRHERPLPAGISKSITDIEHEWDLAADLRAQQIDSRKDLSFHLVLLPTLDRLRTECDQASVLDAGCGTGYLTEHLAASAGSVVGVDVSHASIEIARRRHPAQNVTYVQSSLEDFAARSEDHGFSLIVANMVLTTTPDLQRFLSAVSRLLMPAGRFIFTIPHPWFWPHYWEYSSAAWFRYEREIAIEAPFKISLEETGLTTTHFHRPLEQYVKALANERLRLSDVEEPLPRPQDRDAYPEKWQFPRFLAGRAVYLGSGRETRDDPSV